jgi:Radical SAM superfamily
LASVILWNSSIANDIPRHHRTLGAYQIASWIRQNHYSAKVIEFSNEMLLEDLIAITENHIDDDTLMIGVSNTFWTWTDRDMPNWKLTLPDWLISAKNLIELKYPKIKWAMGGCKTHLSEYSDWENFIGSAEDSLIKRLDELAGVSRINKLFDIKSAFNRYLDNDCISPHEIVPIELGRGCMFKCKFCSFKDIGKKIGTYSKSYECLLAEIMHHHDNWGTTKFFYVDDTVNESVERLRMLAKVAKQVPFDLQWIGYLRADLIWAHPEQVNLLEESGLLSGFFGIESFEEHSSKLIGKGWSGRHAKSWLKQMRSRWDQKITWTFGMMVGLPGQTREQLIDDTNWLIDNDMHNWNYNYLWLDPNQLESEFSRNSQKYGFAYPDQSRIWYWENGYWNLDKAKDVALICNRMSKTHIKYAAWDLGGVISLGYDPKDVMFKYKHEIDQNDMLEKRTNLVNSYIRSNI